MDFSRSTYTWTYIWMFFNWLTQVMSCARFCVAVVIGELVLRISFISRSCNYPLQFTLEPTFASNVYRHFFPREAMVSNVIIAWSLCFLAGGHKERSDIVYLGWPRAPSYMSPNGRRGVLAGSTAMSTVEHITWHGAQINFGDLTPYLTYAPKYYL